MAHTSSVIANCTKSPVTGLAKKKMTRKKNPGRYADVGSRLPADPMGLLPEEQFLIMNSLRKLIQRQRLTDRLTANDKSKGSIESDREFLPLAFGTDDPEVINRQITYLQRVLDIQDRDSAIRYITAMLYGIAPRNQLEGLLAVQMIAANHIALSALVGAEKSPLIPAATFYDRRANKALSLFVRQMELLNQMRQGGHTVQKVIVEKVEVQSGGQAVVGAVTGGRG